MKDKVLQLLLDGESLSTAQIASVLSVSAAEVEEAIARLQAEKSLLGWRPVLNPETFGQNRVRAAIEVRISPERGGGFDRLASRISQFEQVESCYLMSGGYDLMVILTGNTLHEVASFVSERLSTIEGVLSTATHFLLKAYKEQGFLLESGNMIADKPPVSP